MVELIQPPSPTDSAGKTPPESQSVQSLVKTNSDSPFANTESPSKAGQKEKVISIVDGPEYPGQLALSFILIALLMAMFLVRDL